MCSFVNVGFQFGRANAVLPLTSRYLFCSYLQILSSVRIIIIHTASLDRCKRRGDTLRQNVETISETALSLLYIRQYTKQYLLLRVGKPEREALCDEGRGVAKLGEVCPIGRHLVRQLLLRLSQGHIQQGQVEQVGCNRDSEFTKNLP